MSDWLDRTIKLVKGSGLDLKDVKYQSIVIIFYDHLSNRNLSVLIASLFDLDESDVYFNIDKIISDGTKFDIDEICMIKKHLYENDFQDWIDSDEF